MRVTPQMITQRALDYSRRRAQSLADLQLQASSGSRIHRISDDPVAASELLNRQLIEGRYDTQLETIRTSRNHLNGSVSQLLEAADVFTKAKDVALEAAQASRPELLAQEIDRLFDRLVSVANSGDGVAAYFAGSGSNRDAVEVSELRGSVLNFQASDVGGAERASVSIGSLSVDVRYTATEVFFPRDRQPTQFVGRTGAQPGTAVDSATGVGQLQIRHTATTYLGGSGVAPGLNSVEGDTIVGPPGAHQLSIQAGTIALNNGPPIPFDGTETNLEVIGSSGEVVYLDTTGVGSFTGDVDITADGVASVDGGASEFVIDYSENQVITHSETGEATHVDSRVVRFVGFEYIDYPGTVNAFSALISLRETLVNSADLPAQDNRDALQRRIADLDRIRDNFLDVVGDQSATLENLDTVEARTEDQRLETQKIIGQLASADLADVAVQLNQEETLLQFTRASSVRLLNTSILDFLG